MPGPLQVFVQFFVLGLTSFGGPVAHLGCFHERFVQRERPSLCFFHRSCWLVRILLAALFQPVWQTGIRGGAEFSLALVAFVLLVSCRQPAWRVVLFCAGVGGLTLA